jgi:hypothetical protein
MKFKLANYKETDSLILSLENLTSEYNNVLNMYNQVQQELDKFANSKWTVNPYLNKNIQFTTGEIAYVTINGSVYLYGFLQGLEDTINTDQTIVNDLQTEVVSDQNTINADQTIVNNDQTTVNNQQNVVNQARTTYNTTRNASNMFMFGAMTAGETAMWDELQSDKAVLSTDESNLTQATNNLNNANAELTYTTNYLNAEENDLSEAEINLQTALFKLGETGCPAINSIIKVNLPWLPEYAEPYYLIPTNPPLITMGTFTYNNGVIGYTNKYTGDSVGNNSGCNSLNATLTPPPYDIIAVLNTSYVGTPLLTLPNSNIELCRASCYSTPNCTGATFNSETKTCSLASGSGTLQPATTPGTTALIPQITQYLLILSQLNFRLTEINNQILNITKSEQSLFDTYTNDNAFDDKLLKNTYKKLIEEGKIIDKMINDIEKTQYEEDAENVTTDTQYFRYGLLLAFSIIIFIILVFVHKSNPNAANTDQQVQLSLFFIIFMVAIVVLGVIVLRKLGSGTAIY